VRKEDYVLEALGPVVVRMASSFPLHATYYLNGHSFMERELTRGKIGFRKDDNAFLAGMTWLPCRPPPTASAPPSSVSGSTTGRSSSARSSQRKSAAKRACRVSTPSPGSSTAGTSSSNAIFRFTRPSSAAAANRTSEIFGVRLNKRMNGKPATVIDQIEHGHHVFRACLKHA